MIKKTVLTLGLACSALAYGKYQLNVDITCGGNTRSFTETLNADNQTITLTEGTVTIAVDVAVQQGTVSYTATLSQEGKSQLCALPIESSLNQNALVTIKNNDTSDNESTDIALTFNTTEISQ